MAVCSYQRNRKASVRLHALSFYLQEKKVKTLQTYLHLWAQSASNSSHLCQCFPDKVDINAALDLMLQVTFIISDTKLINKLDVTDVFLVSAVWQCCSTELTCESGAAMAASLANGGLCPLSGDQVLSPAATRSTLSMMQVAGMKEYSSTFQFKVPSAEYKCQNTIILYSKLILIITNN